MNPKDYTKSHWTNTLRLWLLTKKSLRNNYVNAPTISNYTNTFPIIINYINTPHQDQKMFTEVFHGLKCGVYFYRYFGKFPYFSMTGQRNQLFWRNNNYRRGSIISFSNYRKFPNFSMSSQRDQLFSVSGEHDRVKQGQPYAIS